MHRGGPAGGLPKHVGSAPKHLFVMLRLPHKTCVEGEDRGHLSCQTEPSSLGDGRKYLRNENSEKETDDE